MTQTTFTDNVLVDGSQDIEQLRVQGHSTQNDALQTWENSVGDVLAQVTGDGRLIVGDNATPDSLIEAHRLEASTSKPKRGLHSLGQVSGTLATLVQWIVGELELRGSNAIDALHTAFRIRAANLNTGTPTANAELRAADVEVINDATAGAAALPKATGLQVAVTNASGKTITDAAALRLKLNNAGTITNPYAIFSEGPGITHLEDFAEMKVPAAGVPGTPATDFIRLYPKSDGKLYAKNSSGAEYDLTGGSGGAPTDAKYITSSLNANLSDEIAIPGLAADADILGRKGGGTADNEFDSGSSPFTWSSAPASEDVNTTLKSHYYVRIGADNTERWGLYNWTPGSGAFDLRAKLLLGTAKYTNINVVGLVVQTSDGATHLLLQFHRNGTSFLVNAYTYQSGVYTQRGTTFPFGTNEIYLRVRRDGSNNFTFEASTNGLLWTLIGTHTFTFTIAKVGLRLHSDSTTAYEVAVDWIRSDV